jgi:hypothetical protein
LGSDACAFEERFGALCSGLYGAHIAALALLLAAFILLGAPAPFLDLACAGDTYSRHATRWFFTQQHGDNQLFEIVSTGRDR